MRPLTVLHFRHECLRNVTGEGRGTQGTPRALIVPSAPWPARMNIRCTRRYSGRHPLSGLVDPRRISPKAGAEWPRYRALNTEETMARRGDPVPPVPACLRDPGRRARGAGADPRRELVIPGRARVPDRRPVYFRDRGDGRTDLGVHGHGDREPAASATGRAAVIRRIRQHDQVGQCVPRIARTAHWVFRVANNNKCDFHAFPIFYAASSLSPNWLLTGARTRVCAEAHPRGA